MSWEEDFLVAVATLEAEENRKKKEKKSKKQSKKRVTSKSYDKSIPKKSAKSQPKPKSSTTKNTSSSGQSGYKFKSGLFQMAEDSVRMKQLLEELVVSERKQTESSKTVTSTPKKQDAKVGFDINRALEDFERIQNMSGNLTESVYWSGYLDYLQYLFADDDTTEADNVDFWDDEDDESDDE